MHIHIPSIFIFIFRFVFVFGFVFLFVLSCITLYRMSVRAHTNIYVNIYCHVHIEIDIWGFKGARQVGALSMSDSRDRVSWGILDFAREACRGDTLGYSLMVRSPGGVWGGFLGQGALPTTIPRGGNLNSSCSVPIVHKENVVCMPRRSHARGYIVTRPPPSPLLRKRALPIANEHAPARVKALDLGMTRL